MKKLPNRFKNEFDTKGETFFEIAELLYTNHGQQFTLDEIEDTVDVTKQQVSSLLADIEEGEEPWINKTEGQMTVVWNTETQNPASTETTKAVGGFYGDLWALLKYHSKTAPGMYVIIGSFMFATTLILVGTYIGFTLRGNSSGFPLNAYLALAISSFVAGGVMTALGPFQAFVNRHLWPRLPPSILENND